MMIEIDFSRRGTLTEQVVCGLRGLVEERGIRPGSRLPSVRRFAAIHGISKFTTVQAYDRLVASGHLRSKPGAGFFVAAQAGRRDAHEGAKPPELATDVRWLMHRQTGTFRLKHLPGYDWLPPRWLEDSGLMRAMRRVSRLGLRASIGAYGDPMGYRPLREVVGRQLAEIAVDATADQVLLTSGTTGAVDLVSRNLIRRNDVVLVDDPGSFRIVAQMRVLGAKVMGVPWTGKGPDLARMESIAAATSPRLYVTAPIARNPTGCSMSRESAFRLLQLADRYDFHVIEDDVFGAFHPDPPPRLASLDGLNRVIYVNGFSKELSPRVRVGYLAAHRDLVGTLVDFKMITQATCPELMERLVHQVLIDGDYRKHVARLRCLLRQARERALRGLETIGLEPSAQDGHGLFTWMTVPGVPDTTPLAEMAAGHGMLLAPGAMFSPHMTLSAKMRFNVGFSDSPSTLRLIDALVNQSMSDRPQIGSALRPHE